MHEEKVDIEEIGKVDFCDVEGKVHKMNVQKVLLYVDTVVRKEEVFI